MNDAATARSLDDRQSDISDLTVEVNSIAEDLESAESCESSEDFDANIGSAIRQTEALLRSLRALKG